MRFEVVDHVPYPLEDVFSTMRDKLPDLVPFLPDVKDIKCLETSELPDGRIKLVNQWFAEDKKIPKALKKFISAEQLGWIDYAEWNNEQKVVDYRLEMMFFKEYVDVHGQNSFTGDDKQTTIKLRGELNLDLARHPMIPRFLAGSITGQVEKLVLALIKPNLVKVNRGIEQHLAAQ